MIDNLSLLTTSLAILYIIFRAAKLDRMLPWIGGQQPVSAERTSRSGRDATVPWRERGRSAVLQATLVAPPRGRRPR